MAVQMTVNADPLPLQTDADGVFRVGGSRITLDTVVGAFEDGASPEQIALRYPTLHLADIYSVLGYYLRHRAEVRTYLQQRESEADRERLLVRQAVAEAEQIGVSNGWPPGFFEHTYGSLRDEPLVREPQGEYETRDELP